MLGRGVQAENITILYADGVKQGTISEDFDTNLTIDDLFEGLNDKPVDVNELTDQQWSIFYDKYSINDLKIQASLREVIEFVALAPVIDESSIETAQSYRQKVDSVNKSLDKSNSTLKIKYKHDRSEKDPSKIILQLELYGKSDFSYVEEGTTILPGTKSALENAVKLGDNSLTNKITNNDSLFVWTFDHGGADDYYDSNFGDVIPPDFQNINPTSLTGWEGENIHAGEFAKIFKDAILKAKTSTFALRQCFAGGLLQVMKDDTSLAQSGNWFGMAATNQYQPSFGSYFADSVAKGLTLNKRTG